MLHSSTFLIYFLPNYVFSKIYCKISLCGVLYNKSCITCYVQHYTAPIYRASKCHNLTRASLKIVILSFLARPYSYGAGNLFCYSKARRRNDCGQTNTTGWVVMWKEGRMFSLPPNASCLKKRV